MIIKVILNILKQLEKADSGVLFGRYSSANVWRQFAASERRRAGWKSKEEIIAENREGELKRFYNALNSLKNQGFIKKIDAGTKKRKSMWAATKRGLEKLIKLNSNQNQKVPPIQSSVTRKDKLKIVVFDIPESHKYYRAWLRKTLINFGFRMLQKSVWIGDSAFPEEFMHTIRRLNLSSCVHIFSVQDTGTLLS